MTCSAIKKLSEIYIKATKINDTKTGEQRRNAKKKSEINSCCCMYSSI